MNKLSNDPAVLERTAKTLALKHSVSEQDFFDMWRGVFTDYAKYPWVLVSRIRALLTTARELRIHGARTS